MTVGVQFFLPNGATVQADDTYRNLSVREQGSAATTSPEPIGVGSSVLFYRTGLTMPLLAVAGAGLAAGQVFYDAANARWGFVLSCGAAVGSQVPYYIFDVPYDSNPGFGLQIFDAVGRKTFDILQKYLRVIDMFSSAARPQTLTTYDTSRAYAVIHMVNGWSIDYHAGNTMMKMSSVSGGVVKTQGVAVDGNQGLNVTYEQQSTVLVVDVTNY